MKAGARLDPPDPMDPAERPPHELRTSRLLAQIVQGFAGERITMRDLLTALGDRSFALVLLILAVPNSLPIPSPPGLSTVFGVPLGFFAFQMMIGRPTPWLPRRFLDRSVAHGDLRRVVIKVLPWLEKLERYCRPRGRLLTGPTAERVLGGYFLILSVVLALPIPGGNFPPGLAMTVMALGLLENDGRVVAIGAGIGAVAIAVVVAIFVFSVELLIGIAGRLW